MIKIELYLQIPSHVLPPNISNLNASRNCISSLDDFAFSSNMKLTSIDLRHNKLTNISLHAFSNDITKYNKVEGTKIYLSDNPIECRCTLKWLINNEANIDVADLDQMTCKDVLT